MEDRDANIYIIRPTCEHEEGDVYYGMTLKQLKERFWAHKWDCQYVKNNPDGNRRSYSLAKIFDKYGADNCEIVLIQTCKYKDARRIETEYIKNNKCVNTDISFATKEQKYAKQKEYIKTNPAMVDYYTKYYECGCGGGYNIKHKNRHLSSIHHQQWEQSQT
jgi:hypothetical protein